MQKPERSPGALTGRLPEAAAQPDARTRPTPRATLERLGTKWRMIPVLVVLAIIWAYFGHQNELFLTPRNLSNLAGQIVVTSLVALGLLFVLLVGEIDLSVAAASAVSAGVVAKLTLDYHLGVAAALPAGLATGVALGAVNGLIVTFFRAPSFIVTLGVSLALQGLLLQLLPPTNLYSLVQSPVAAISTTHLSAAAGWSVLVAAVVIFSLLRAQRHLAMRSHGLASSLAGAVLLPLALVAGASSAVLWVFTAYKGLPLPVAILLLVLGALSYITTQTRFGLHLYAMGANPEAAARAGIPVNLIKVAAFMISGALVAAGGILAAARVMGVSPESADPTLLLEAVAAAVIGGVSLFGGRGSVWSALAGALVIGSVSNGLLLINASTEARLEVQGAILVVAVVLDALISRLGARR